MSHSPRATLLPVRDPFAADALLAFLALRAIPGVEDVAGGRYRRTVRLRHGHGLIELEPAAGHVRALLHVADPRDADEAARRARAVLDLDADPVAIDALLGQDPLLSPLVAATPGVRVPGTAEPAELAIRAVLGQQVSVAGARTLAARLVQRLGEDLDLGAGARLPPGAPRRVFPASPALATLDPAAIAMPRARGRALVALATALADGTLRLGPDADRAAAEAALVAVPGIGPWTAAYVAMRALGDRDAFLPTDLALRRALRRNGASDELPTLARHAEAWRPYRAYGVVHLWSVS